ncbi:hypothetical protein WS95_27540 [Burkholderia sp. MSMB1826]|nr:hypothetical protein WS95_27540 [Burkholderia sp. MSMB1826]
MRLELPFTQLLQIALTRKPLDANVRKNLHLAINHMNVDFLSLREMRLSGNARRDSNRKTVPPTLEGLNGH